MSGACTVCPDMRLTTSKGLELASSLLKDDAVSVRTTSVASSRVTGEALPRIAAKMATATMESFIVVVLVLVCWLYCSSKALELEAKTVMKMG